METIVKRNIKSGEQFNALFPKAVGDNQLILRNAHLWDTMELIPKVIGQTLDQTARLAPKLYDRDLYKCCENIWEFVYDHIDYHRDQPGAEQVRSPARSWADRFSGVDCDCYSVFISSILNNLNIPHVLRITKYSSDTFQHIYPVAIAQDGKEIIIDCVTEFFDHEVPYSEKKDYPMQLQYLNGLGCPKPQDDNRKSDYIDFEEPDLEGNWEGKSNLGQIAYEEAADFISVDGDDAGVYARQYPLQDAIYIPDPGFPASNGLDPVTRYFQAEPIPVYTEGNVESITNPLAKTNTTIEPLTLFPNITTAGAVRSATCTCTLNGDDMGSIFSKIGNFISQNVKSAVNDVSNVVQDVKSFAEQNVKSATQDVSRIATGIAKFTTQNIKSAANDVADAAQDVAKFAAQNIKSGIEDAGRIGQQVIDFAKKFTPLLVLARMGFRLGLKLNLFNISRRLRWGFVHPDYIQQYGLNEEWYGKMTRLAKKVEDGYKAMGGEDGHVRDAVMNGKGNSVNPIDSSTLAGFGYLPTQFIDPKKLNIQMSIPQILGQEEYNKEMNRFREMSGLGELGWDPATLTAITAAIGTLAAIAKDLMAIGAQGAGTGVVTQDLDPSLATSDEYSVQDAGIMQAYNEAMAKLNSTGTGDQYALPDTSNENNLSEGAKQLALSYLQNESKPLDISTLTNSLTKSNTGSGTTNPLYINTANTTGTPPATQESFFKKHKTLFIVSGVAAGVIGIGAWIYFARKNKKKKEEQRLQSLRKPLNGTRKKTMRKKF